MKRVLFVTSLITSLMLVVALLTACAGATPTPTQSTQAPAQPTQAPAQSTKTLTIAGLFTMSGTGAAWGITSDRGLKMVAEDINAKGGIKVGGDTYTIKTVSYDTRFQPAEALAAANKVASDGIKYVIGNGGETVPATQPVFEKNKIIFMGVMGGGSDLTSAKFPYTFRSMPSPDQVYGLLYPELVKMSGSPLKLANLQNNNPMGRSEVEVAKKVIKERGLPIEMFEEYVEGDAVDFAPLVTRLMAQGVNFIQNELRPSQFPILTKQAREAGYKGRIGTLRNPLFFQTTLEAAGKQAMEGYITGVEYPDGVYPTPEFEQLNKKYQAAYGEPMTSNTYWQYNAVQFLVKAIEKAGTIDSERVASVMYDLDAETLLGRSLMVGKSLGYGIKTQMSFKSPFGEVKDGQLKLMKELVYEEK